MHIEQVLPLIGGGVPLAIGIVLMLKRGLREKSQMFFFLAIICLGLFAFLEGLAYLTDSESAAKVLIVTSKYIAFWAPYLIYGFALALRGKQDSMKTLFPLLVGWVMIAPFFTIESMARTEWGWTAELNRPILLLTFMLIFYFMSMAMREMFELIEELKEAKNPFKTNMEWITAGFFLWTVLAIGTSAVANWLATETVKPVFSFLHVIPTIMVTYGFMTQNIKNGSK